MSSPQEEARDCPLRILLIHDDSLPDEFVDALHRASLRSDATDLVGIAQITGLHSAATKKTFQGRLIGRILRLELAGLRAVKKTVRGSKHTTETLNQNLPIRTIPASTLASFLRTLSVDLILASSSSRTLVSELAPDLPLLSISLGREGSPQSTIGFAEAAQKSAFSTYLLEFTGVSRSDAEWFIHGSLPTHPVFSVNRARLLAKVAGVVVQLARSAVGGRMPTAAQAGIENTSTRVSPGTSSVLLYFVNVFSYVIKALARRFLNSRVLWSIAFAPSAHGTGPTGMFTMVPNPEGRFLADPWPIRRQSRSIIFAEDYSFSAKRAGISAVEILDGESRFLGPVIQEGFHMSFPYVFEVDDTLYMCPETSANRDIRLYRCVEFPMLWEHHKTLMTSVSAADTVIFPAEGSWWMLTNLDSGDISDHNSELYLFKADTFDSQQWVPHPANPICLDAVRARNGGFIRDGQEMIRVHQVHGFNVYGQTFGFAHITSLSADEYREQSMTPPAIMRGAKDIGLHTYTSSTDLVTIDIARRSTSRPKP